MAYFEAKIHQIRFPDIYGLDWIRQLKDWIGLEKWTYVKLWYTYTIIHANALTGVWYDFIIWTIDRLGSRNWGRSLRLLNRTLP